MPKLPILLFAAMLLLSGCLEKLSVQDRLSCLELTSYSFTSVPDCASQEGCFGKVQESFPMGEKVFPSDVRESIFGSKNHLARSWLFLNNAKSNLKQMHSLCENASDFSGIARQANELNANLAIAAKEIDYFSQSAALAINSEIDDLGIEDINLVREEPLFDDYIVLNQNALDFAQHNSEGKTYASKFLKEAKSLESIGKTLSASSLLSEKSLLGIISQNSSLLSSEAKGRLEKRDFPVSFIYPVFSGVSKFFADFFALGGSVGSLKNLPSYGVFESLNRIIGADNSAASAFFKTFRDDSAHRVLLKEKISGQKAAINSSLDALEKKAGLLEKNLANVALTPMPVSGEGNASLVLESGLSRAYLENFGSEFGKGASSIKSSLASLEEAEFLGNISLGYLGSSIKAVSGKVQKLSDNVSKAEAISAESGARCSQEVLRIEEKISGKGFDSTLPSIISARERLRAEIISYHSSGKGSSCQRIVSDFASLLGLLDSSLPQEEFSMSIDKCISRAEALLGLLEDSDGSGLQLSSLKRLAKPYQNPSLVLESCETISARLTKNAYSLPEVIEAQQNYATLSGKISSLKSLLQNFPLIASGTLGEAGPLLRSFDSISADFENGKFGLSAIARAKEILESERATLSKANELLPSLASRAVEKYMEIGFIPRGPSGNALARLSLQNPGPEIDAAFTSEISLDSSDAQEVFSTKNVSSSPSGKKTVLRFSGLLSGLNSLILDMDSGRQQDDNSGQFLQTQQEKERILLENAGLGAKAFAFPEKSPELAQMQKKIELLANQGKLKEAGEQLSDFKKEVESAELREKSEAGLKERAADFSEKLSKIISLKKGLSENASALLQNLKSVPENELAEVYAFSPVTLERLQKLSGLAAIKTITPQKVSELLEKGKFGQLEELLQSGNADEELAKIESASEEAVSALERLKVNALSSYNSALAYLKTSPEKNLEAEELLIKSRQALEAKSYLESLLNSGKASAITGAAILAPKSEIPLAVYPLALVILLAAFYAFTKKEEKPKQPLKIRKANEPIENVGTENISEREGNEGKPKAAL